MSRRLAAMVLFALLAVAAIAPVRSYDAFWHLATGRWITEHRALPRLDPFTVASERVDWINGEWLYHVALYAAHALGGIPAIVIAHALLAAAIFTIGFFVASRDGDVPLALITSAIAFAGTNDRLGVRPSSAAALFVVLALALLGSRMRLLQLTIAYVVVTVLWMNVHPSALLAPIFAATTVVIDRKRVVVATASAVALLVNPFGIRGVTAPFELASLIRSGAFVNAEWLPSPLLVFPLLYLVIIAGVALFAWRRAELWRFAIFVLLAFLAVRYVRNQGLFFAAVPVLIAPLLTAREARATALKTAFAIAVVMLVFIRGDHSIDVDASRFPVKSAARLKETGLPGNIYNADQFGGYLIWTFYPQRRVLTDGRNELYRMYIAEDAAAHADSRAWNALLRTYHVDLAVDEISATPIIVQDMKTGQRRPMPAWQIRYPSSKWALIGRDDVSMVFARREAFPQEVLSRWELRD